MMNDDPAAQLRMLVAQAVAAVHHADDEEFLLRCVVLSGHDPAAVRRELGAFRATPVRVPVVGERVSNPRIVRELEPERVCATLRYLDTGVVGGADEMERMIDAVLLLADRSRVFDERS